MAEDEAAAAAAAAAAAPGGPDGPYGHLHLGAPEAEDDDDDTDGDGLGLGGGAPSRRGHGALPPEAYQTDASSDGEMERLASSVGISGEYRRKGWCKCG